MEDNVRINLNESDVILKNSIDLCKDRDYLKALGECGIEPQDSISHKLSQKLVNYNIPDQMAKRKES